jgi:hypothetical protein
MVNLLEFSILIKVEDHNQPIYPLTVFTDRGQVRNQIDSNIDTIRSKVEAMESEVHFETSSRIDNSVTNGILRAAEEVLATTIIMGWNNKLTPIYKLFGNVLVNLLEKSERMVLVLKTPTEVRKIRNIHVFCTDAAEYEEGFALWLDTLVLLFQKLKIKGIFYSDSSKTLDAIQRHGSNNNISKYFELYRNASPQLIEEELRHDPMELLIFVHSRKKTVSYNRKFEQFMNTTINRYEENNILVVYPEQW